MLRRSSVLVALLLATPALSQSMPVPKDLYGRYARGGDCTRQPRVIASPAGSSSKRPRARRGRSRSMSATVARAARYEGIQVWVMVKYGKDKWGGDNMPVTMMFNDGERRGSLLVDHDNTLRTPLGMPMTQVVQARSFRLCKEAKAGA
ncbi:hypothetical protein ACFSLT_05115 [Novosphingobium resinovorum]